MHHSVQTGCPPTVWSPWSPCNPSIVLTGPPQLGMPNPLYPVSTAPFTLVFISGQISTCFDCRKGFMKPAATALNLVVKHEDNRSYTTHNGSPRQRYGNVYYHLNHSCITTKQPHFTPSRLVVSQEVIEGARQPHSDYLKTMLGVSQDISTTTNN